MNASLDSLLHLETAGCRASGGVVAFCHPKDLAQLAGLPNLRARVVASAPPGPTPSGADGVVVFAWTDEAAWADPAPIQALLAEGSGVELLFLARANLVPTAAIDRLASYGHEVVTAIDNGMAALLRCGRDRARRRRVLDEALRRHCADLAARHAVPLAAPGDYHPFGGHGFSAPCPVPASRADANGCERRSRLVLLEDDRPLGTAHAAHHLIRGIGQGLYSHWEERVFFAASDNSDPNTNGRTYRILELSERPVGMERRLARATGVLPPMGGTGGPADPAAEDLGVSRPVPGLRAAGQAFDGWLARREPPSAPAGVSGDGGAGTGRRILLMIGYLGPGGAERQICNLARGLLAEGYEPSLMTMSPLRDEGRHYADMLLHASDIPLLSLGELTRSGFRQAVQDDGFRAVLREAAPVLRRLPEDIRFPVLEAMLRMHRLRPAAVVCYLDMVNVVGGLAALLVGVPRILLSGRNVNPTHFPNLYHPWFRGLYRMLVRSPRVALTANADAGAESYAAWLGMPAEAVTVIVNGIAIEDMPRPTLVQRVEARLSVGAGSSVPLVVGIFRLAPEKQPLLFVEIVARLRREFPRLKAAIAGVGPLQDAMERRIRELGIDDAVHFLGRRGNVHVLLGAADLLLHTAKVEGLPNVIMEAQWQGLPVVCTAAGGTRSALSPDLQRHMHAIDDIDGLTGSCLALLRDPAARHRVAAAAQADVHRRFTVAALVANTLSALRLSPPVAQAEPGPPPPVSPPTTIPMAGRAPSHMPAAVAHKTPRRKRHRR